MKHFSFNPPDAHIVNGRSNIYKRREEDPLVELVIQSRSIPAALSLVYYVGGMMGLPASMESKPLESGLLFDSFP